MHINLNAPINTLSYGLTSFNILRELRQKASVSLWPIGRVEVDSQAYPKALQLVELSVKSGQMFNEYNAPSLRIYHQFSMAERIGRGPAIGFPIFELDTFSILERNHLSSLDAIFVTSSWGKQIVEENRIKVPCHVIPLGYDPEIFKPLQIKKSPIYTFGNVGKYEVRKGHDELIEMFNTAFEPADNVRLLLSCENPFPNSGIDKFKANAKNSKMGEKIHFIPRLNSQIELNEFYNNCDCMVFPSKAEGWNLPLLEALAAGTNCIATDYSAHTEFAPNNPTCWMIRMYEKEFANDGRWFHGNGRWGKFGQEQKDICIQYMREASKGYFEMNSDILKVKMNEEALKFTWENTVNHILKAIR